MRPKIKYFSAGALRKWHSVTHLTLHRGVRRASPPSSVSPRLLSNFLLGLPQRVGAPLALTTIPNHNPNYYTEPNKLGLPRHTPAADTTQK